jgi:hypothetical protein
MSETQELTVEDEILGEEGNLFFGRNSPSKMPAWGFFFPSLRCFTIVYAPVFEVAQPRAAKKAQTMHPAILKGDKRYDVKYLVQEGVLIKTTHPDYLKKFNSVIYAGKLNNLTLTRTCELLYGRRDDYRKITVGDKVLLEYDGIKEYTMHLYKTLERCGPFPFTQEDAEN